MPEGADVTIRYAFLPTESSIKTGAEKMLKGLNETAAKQKWGSGIYSEAYHKRITSVMKDSVGKIDNEYKKTTSGIINLLRAFQQKTSLQTKLMALMKFVEGKGITGGVGGGAEGAAGAGGGMMGALGLIAGLLAVIVVVVTIISAFFDAVGPIIKVVMKMLSAVILILLMPFLKRGLPVLFGILKWMITAAKGISSFVDEILTYFENIFGRMVAGDPMAFLELLIGPIGMLLIHAGKKLIEFLANVDWVAVVNKIIPILEEAFNFAKNILKGFVVSVFGEDAWNEIEKALDFISDIWDDFKNSIGPSTLALLDKFTAIKDAFGEFLTGFINWFNTLFPGLNIAHPQVTSGEWTSRKFTILPPPVDTTGMSDAEAWQARFDAANPDWISTSVQKDFISRPGGGLIPFSSDDTIIGTKTPGALGGINITNNLSVSAGVDKNEFRKLLSDFSRQQARDLRNRTSYYGG